MIIDNNQTQNDLEGESSMQDPSTTTDCSPEQQDSSLHHTYPPPDGSPPSDHLPPPANPQPPDYLPPPAYPQPPSQQKSTAAKRKKRRKRVRLIVGLSVTAVVIAGIVFGMYWLFSQEKQMKPLSEPVYRGMLETAVRGYGFIRPVESADIAVLSRSRVKESFYEMGDMVFEGDLLFTLETEALDDEITELHLKIDDIQRKIDRANVDLELLLGDEAERISNLVLRTPFAGQLMDASDLRTGDFVSSGQRVGILVDDRNLSLSLYFSYAYENGIAIGQTADISIPVAMSVVTGRVSEINKVRRVSPEGTTLFEVIITLENPGTLTEGMQASAVIQSGAEDFYPYEAGELKYGRSEDMVIGAPGRLTYVNLRSYMDYRRGETLCRIEYREDNAQAEALMQQIKGFELEIEVVEEEIAEKTKGYANLNVTAPMSGTVMYNNLIPGEIVEPGLAVISIAKLDKMMVEAQVDERQASQVRPGMPVEINIWTANGQMTMPGVVKSISLTPSSDPNMMMGGGMVTYPAVFEMENYSGMLMSGQYVDYRLVVEQRWDILIAPVIAVKNTEFGTCVFVHADERPDNAIDLGEGIVPNGFFAVPVECGIGNENGIEIISGVEEGTEVFTQIIPLDEEDQGFGRGGMVYYG